MKHTFKSLDGKTFTVQPCPHTRMISFTCSEPEMTIADFLIPAELASVIAQSIELAGERLMNAEKPLINAQALEAAKSFGEGMQV
jgi:hypothetical protein